MEKNFREKYKVDLKNTQNNAIEMFIEAKKNGLQKSKDLLDVGNFTKRMKATNNALRLKNEEQWEK